MSDAVAVQLFKRILLSFVSKPGGNFPKVVGQEVTEKEPSRKQRHKSGSNFPAMDELKPQSLKAKPLVACGLWLVAVAVAVAGHCLRGLGPKMGFCFLL